MFKPQAIIINGATGVGKSTATNILASKYNCECISSDKIRKELRSQIDERLFPCIFRSTYELESDSTDAEVLQNYSLQTSIILNAVLVKSLFQENKILIFDGVHFNRDFLASFDQNNYYVFVLKMPNSEEHIKRIQQEKNERISNIINRSKYIKNIRTIGRFLENQWSFEKQHNKNIFMVDNVEEIQNILRMKIK